ncbi:unnamed protein product [Phyllotreta striolata]|uniref:Uncharacterized protein n=1 Tax=Phyllotreta striolata TaxID=444603 RepID=A0A9N9TRI3_PHYSR|nr:unnamed protein product [Phyllotreta striolata]
MACFNFQFKLIIYLVVISTLHKSCSARKLFTIGVLFNEIPTQSELSLNDTIIRNNIIEKETPISLSSKVQLVSSTDIFDTSKTICNLIDDGIMAIMGQPTCATSPIIESTCKSLNLPYILTSWRKSSYEESPIFLNFHPDADRLGKGIADIIKSLKWMGILIFYEEEEGLVKLQEVLKLQNVKNTDSQDFIRVQHLTNGPDYRPIFKKYRNTTENNIIIDCKTENILPILSQAKSLDMLDIGFNYFLTSLDAHTVDYSSLNITANITIIRIFDPKSEELSSALRKWSLTAFEFYRTALDLKPNMIKTETVLFHDALTYLSAALKKLPYLPESKVNCFAEDLFSNGPTIINTIKYLDDLPTITGPIKFDEYGNRIDFRIYAYTLDDDQLIATYQALNETVILARTSEETDLAATSNLKKIKVIVGTRIVRPFLMEVANTNGEVLTGNDRYEGYTKDLMTQIAKIIDFTFELHLTEGNLFGEYKPDKKRWIGLIGDLLERRAHLALCDSTINLQRQSVVDFSMPFMTLGISILHTYPEKEEARIFAFLEPFHTSVWIYSATMYLVLSIILYFVCRMTPGDWENPHPCDDNPQELENIWTLKNCHWATLGTIMNQGCDILPKGISSKFALAMWWFFALIITNSYIANLTAFLTKANLEPPIKDAEDLSKQNKIKYGCMEGGSTMQFFRDSNISTYQKMYLNMKMQSPKVFEKSNEDGVSRVRQDKKGWYAFLMESTLIEYYVETNCDLKQIGGWLDTKSYGIAMPMNAPYRGAIDKAILELQETGVLNELKLKWWKKNRNETSCDIIRNKDKDENENDLDLARTMGIFLVLAVGVSIAIFLGVVEFLWNIRNISVEEHLTYWEALKIELKFAVNIWITKKKVKSAASEASSSSIGKEDNANKGDKKKMIQNFLHNASSFMNLNTTA